MGEKERSSFIGLYFFINRLKCFYGRRRNYSITFDSAVYWIFLFCFYIALFLLFLGIVSWLLILLVFFFSVFFCSYLFFFYYFKLFFVTPFNCNLLVFFFSKQNILYSVKFFLFFIIYYFLIYLFFAHNKQINKIKLSFN